MPGHPNSNPHREPDSHADFHDSPYCLLATPAIPYRYTPAVRYLRTAQDAVKQYEDDAALNALPFDRHEELRAVRAFTNAIRLAGNEYLRDPLGIPQISNWNRVTSAIPDFFEMLKDAVNQDNHSGN